MLLDLSFGVISKGVSHECCRGNRDNVRIRNVYHCIARLHRQKSKKVTSKL